ncbi:MAG: alpha-amylase [Pseudobdellovibrionaceae bacterium]
MLSSLCMRLFSFAALMFTVFQVQAAPRTVFVQMFEWPWKDIARECEAYLGPAGFSAVQVSPPHEHITFTNHPWWERYQVASYNLNSRSGSEAEFADMVRRCKNVGVDIYADAVINHAAGMSGGVGFAGTPYQHYNYPGMYSYDDFHHCGKNGNDHIVNYQDRWEVQNCELLGLADLATESEYVRNRIAVYLNHLLDLGVTGFRIDAAKHIPSQDLAAIFSKLKRSPYIYQEIIYDPSGPIQYSEYTPLGDVLAYSYPYSIAYAFRFKNVGSLLSIGQGLPSTDKSIVSLTNHDLERTKDNILSFNAPDQRLYRLAQVFMLAWPFGYPQVFSGYRFNQFDDGPPLNSDLRSQTVLDDKLNCIGSWTCEHRLPEVAAMVDFRNQTDPDFYFNNWWTNGSDQLSFGRGTIGFVAINFSNNNLQRDFSTALPPGDYCNILASNYNIVNRTCSTSIHVNEKGIVSVYIPPMSALALLKTAPYKFRLK